MERAYYIVGDGTIKEAALAVKAKMDAQKLELFDLLRKTAIETGCNPATCLSNMGTCVGLVFDRGEPPESVCQWKKVDKGAWWPKLTTPRGKEIAKRFRSQKPITLDEAIPKSDSFPVLFERGIMHVPRIMFLEPQALPSGFEDLPPVILIVVTPYDEMKVDGPDLSHEEKKQLDRIRPRIFSEILDSHNAAIIRDKDMVTGNNS